MESTILFAQFTLAICALHLVWRVSAKVSKWLADSQSMSHQAKNSSKTKTTRSDWYVFFHCSDLVGKESGDGQSQVRKTLDTDVSKPKTRRSTRVSAR